MGRPKKQTATDTTTTIRTTANTRELLSAHGHGNISEGVRVLIDRLHGIMRRELPALGLEECKAVMGALKGYPLWCDPDVAKSMKLGPALSLELHDYPECEPGEAEQWHVDWAALEATAAALADVQVMALGYATEAAFADRTEPRGDLDALIKRHFRVRAD